MFDLPSDKDADIPSYFIILNIEWPDIKKSFKIHRWEKKTNSVMPKNITKRKSMKTRN